MTSLATNTGLCVRVVESTPASNVARCVGIGIGCEAARLARELVACWTVGMLAILHSFNLIAVRTKNLVFPKSTMFRNRAIHFALIVSAFFSVLPSIAAYMVNLQSSNVGIISAFGTFSAESGDSFGFPIKQISLTSQFIFLSVFLFVLLAAFSTPLVEQRSIFLSVFGGQFSHARIINYCVDCVKRNSMIHILKCLSMSTSKTQTLKAVLKHGVSTHKL
jgi:hypothetical protein